MKNVGKTINMFCLETGNVLMMYPRCDDIYCV